ncbi:MAG: hypothetical protein ABWX96_17630 [Propionibacteriaceae bacterium]
MSTRQGDSEKLAKRCEDAGWRAERLNDGIKIINPDGLVHIIHLTYSDHRSLTNATKDIENRMGLVAAEAQAKRDRLAARRTTLKNDRAAAERRTQAILDNRQEMITKAAGPYLTEAEEPDIDWMTSAHPSPWMRWMYVTPKVAAYVLAHHNTDNRNQGEGDVQRYRDIILSGQWYLTHQGAAFDVRGILQDGQHRFEAIVQAGDVDPDIKVPFAMFVGMPVENFKALDEGRLRTAAQMFKKEGITGGTHMITCLRTVKSFDSENPRGVNRRGKLNTVAAFQLRDSDPDGFTNAIKLGLRGYKRTQITPGIMAAAYYIVRRVNGWDNAYVEAFFEGVIQNRKFKTDLVLPTDDPRAVLLRRFANNKPKTPIDGLLWIITAWNNLVKGHHPHYMRVGDDTAVPAVLRCVPGEGATPRALNGEVDV